MVLERLQKVQEQVQKIKYFLTTISSKKHKVEFARIDFH